MRASIGLGITRTWIFLSAVLALAIGAAPAKGVTFGSNLATAPNDSVCKFQASQLTTYVCSVGQYNLLAGHTASGGLEAPFEGVIVRWSVVSGHSLPGTGTVKLALRTTGGPGSVAKGPEVELPPSPPGTRHTFAERMPVSVAEPIGLRISVANQSAEEAGAPIAFREAGVGMIETWRGEPWEPAPFLGKEDGVELLLSAEIEPDDDGDGYGDLTQDCFPWHPADEDPCEPDSIKPRIKLRAAAKQNFLRSGFVVVRLVSNEGGRVKAAGRLKVQGSASQGYHMGRSRAQVRPGGEVVLRLRVRKPVLKAARAAKRDGKKVMATVGVAVVDVAGNEAKATTRVRSR
jgi:hypothetical protein